MMVKKGWLGFGLLSLAAVGLTACLGEKVPEVELESVPKSALKVSLQEALDIAEATADGKKAYSIERETEEGQPVIEVGIDGREIFVHATSGEVVLIEDLRESEDPEDKEEVEEFLELQALATVPILNALNTGEELAGESAHTVALDNEDGSLVYEVVVGRKEIYVDAGNGDVLYIEEDGSAGKAGSIQVPGDDE